MPKMEAMRWLWGDKSPMHHPRGSRAAGRTRRFLFSRWSLKGSVFGSLRRGKAAAFARPVDSSFGAKRPQNKLLLLAALDASSATENLANQQQKKKSLRRSLAFFLAVDDDDDISFFFLVRFLSLSSSLFICLRRGARGTGANARGSPSPTSAYKSKINSRHPPPSSSPERAPLLGLGKQPPPAQANEVEAQIQGSQPPRDPGPPDAFRAEQVAEL